MPALSQAQSFTMAWFKVAGGGGTCSGPSGGSVDAVSGTIGQPDASGATTGGSYSLTGGFWSILSVVQTAALPNLTINHVADSVLVSWPNTGNYTLRQNSTLAVSARQACIISTLTSEKTIRIFNPVLTMISGTRCLSLFLGRV
jgi:hypothetical protein